MTIVSGWLRGVAHSRGAERLAGGVFVLGFTASTFFLTTRFLVTVSGWTAWSSIVAEGILIWVSISVGQLIKTARHVDRLIETGHIQEARTALRSLVGRDTEQLDEEQIRGAVIESVAENLVDAGIAPVFYLLLGGGALAITYRVINTLDSMFGYKTPELRDFGWAAARLDDAASWLPARLTVLIVSLVGWLFGTGWSRPLGTALQHGRRHASPNSGLPMAAVAGVLGIRLGGARLYDGHHSDHGYIGHEANPIGSDLMRRAELLIKISMLLAVTIVSVAGLWLKGPVWPVN